jgi:hypothetical protein
MIHPKIINLSKLRKDLKVPLEKEKNFRILLNAINQLELSVTINVRFFLLTQIMDLANCKVTAILELLQWMYREYKKPSGKNGKTYIKENKTMEPRMIKSYVGSLVNRQQSLYKESERSQSVKSLTRSRRSLDSRLNQLPKSGVKSVKKSFENIEQQSEKME